jgi:N-acetylglutamate synthase-like GNAT family acetyltransferase
MASKRYWDYPDEWIKLWNEDLTINEGDFDKMSIYKLVAGASTIGFCAISLKPEELEIEHLWLLPEKIGLGYGKYLLNSALEECLVVGIKQILVIADPNAQPFYAKLGFEIIDYINGKPEGRRLPLMRKNL